MNAEEITPIDDTDIVAIDSEDGVAYDPEDDPFYEEDLADEGDLDFEPEYNDY